jgi:cobalt/nickel transport system permease protein
MSGAHRLPSYAHVASPIHRLPAGAKLAVVLLVAIGLALVPPGTFAPAVMVLLALVVLARVARVPMGAFLAHLALVEPFVLGVAVLALFQGRGVSVFASLALKSTACVVAVQLLAHTTPFRDLIDVLRRARVPSLLVSTIALLHRYLFVLVDEAARMRRARAARTWRVHRLRTWRSLATVVALSFVRSAGRAERIHAAMRARGGS